jgi:hypothetical protein
MVYNYFSCIKNTGHEPGEKLINDEYVFFDAEGVIGINKRVFYLLKYDFKRCRNKSSSIKKI